MHLPSHPRHLLVVALFLLVPGMAGTAVAQEKKPAPQALVLAGGAINITLATTGSVELTITTVGDEGFRARGAFDGVTLIGAFDLYGRPTTPCEAADLCLLFTGALELGGRGGWPVGTATTFVLSLALKTTEGEAAGVYHVGPLPGVDAPQYGLLNVSR